MFLLEVSGVRVFLQRKRRLCSPHNCAAGVASQKTDELALVTRFCVPLLLKREATSPSSLNSVKTKRHTHPWTVLFGTGPSLQQHLEATAICDRHRKNAFSLVAVHTLFKSTMKESKPMCLATPRVSVLELVVPATVISLAASPVLSFAHVHGRPRQRCSSRRQGCANRRSSGRARRARTRLARAFFSGHT